ncbi:MAG: DUF1624 domain-containing protein [Oscillospiraceae bacterium]|nr:DUF1624 domain-containing protein [Oscillospiraceae bacterium]
MKEMNFIMDEPRTGLGNAAVARDLTIDRFRGILIILMVIGNGLADVSAFPGIFKHAEDIGFTIADTVAPMFILAIAMTYRSSFLRRYETDKASAYSHFIIRYFALMGLGALFSAGGVVVAQQTPWGVLQSIGMAGLLTLPFIRLGAGRRAAAALAILIIYQLVLDRFWLADVLGSSHGGFYGSISWGAMLILATSMVDWLNASGRRQVIAITALTVVTAASLWVVPVSKNRVTLSFVLLTTLISCFTYIVVRIVSGRLGTKGGLIAYWGEKPLPLFVIHLLLTALSQLPFALLGIYERPFIPAALATLAVLVVMTSYVLWARRLKLRMSL